MEARGTPGPVDKAVEAFLRRWGARPDIVSRAPGRVNLIGEHTDYTGGFVLPMAIDREIAVVGRVRDNKEVHVLSVNFGQEARFTLDEARLDLPRADRQHFWIDYVKGVFAVAKFAGLSVTGADLAIAGDIPQGAGLSSSAALEVGVVLFVGAAAGATLQAIDEVRLAHLAENEFVGVACGIMDQFVSRMARQGAALFLDTDRLTWRYVPVPKDVAIVVTDTATPRQLVASEYNRRRQECEDALAIARRYVGGWRLPRELKSADVEGLRDQMPPVLWKRLRHLVEENARVVEAVAALEAGDVTRVGMLLDASHASLRDLFEVSSPALDAAVEIARSVPGVFGSRMTGAGFGGSTVTLVTPEAVDELRHALTHRLPAQTGRAPRVLVVQAAPGATVEQWE